MGGCRGCAWGVGTAPRGRWGEWCSSAAAAGGGEAVRLLVWQCKYQARLCAAVSTVAQGITPVPTSSVTEPHPSRLQGDLYEQIGIDPPRGVLLYGPPGTGAPARPPAWHFWAVGAVPEFCSAWQDAAVSFRLCRAKQGSDRITLWHVKHCCPNSLQARRCWLRRWRTTPPPPSSAWSARSLCKSTWARCAGAALCVPA